MKIISARDLSKVSFASGEVAARKWWETKHQSVEALLLKQAKLGFRDVKILVPDPYAIFICGILTELGYKTNTGFVVEENQREINVIW